MNKDDFWSVDKLLPRVGSVPSFSSNKITRGISLDILKKEEADLEKAEFGEKIIPAKTRVIRYFRLGKEERPQNDLITKSAAGESSPVPYAPCLLFSPSMLSLSEAQREFFYYFCECCERKVITETSFPYLQLYLCHILRTSLDHNRNFERILWVWEAYRKKFPLTDKLFSDFISDYSFYHRITPPYESLTPIFTSDDFTAKPFLLGPYLFDYLFSSEHKMSRKEMGLVLRTLTQQSFRKSKAYRFHQVFAAACEDAVEKAFEGGLFNRRDLNASLFRIQIPSKVKTTRKLFSALPKEEAPQMDICLCYIPLLNDENIRSRCDEVIRYLENRIRKILKIKNSLSRIHISEEHRFFLEGILLEFEALAPKDDRNEEKYTPSPQTPRELKIDFSAGAQIEEESWRITKSLTEAYTEGGEESVVIGGEKDSSFDRLYERELESLERPAAGEGDFWEFAGALTETEDSFVRISLHLGKDAARRFAASCGQFADGLLLSCNQKAQEFTDDAIFDPAGNIYPDYSDALKEVFPPMEGDQKWISK